MSQRPSAYFFAGGLDTNSSPLHASPGAVINSLNYEPLVEGYGRCEGYERFDGRPSPSEATFFSIQFVNGSIAVAAGDTIVGQTSDATGVAVAVAALDSGSFDDGDAAGTFAVINIDGEFEAGETFRVNGAAAGQIVYDPAERYAPTPELRAAWLRAAQNARRTLITAVPGTGPVRGVAIYNGNIFAWRDNVGQTAGVMWKASPTGWQQVNLGRRLNFGTGVLAFAEGDTIVGATSAASAKVARLVKNAGDWGASASGYIILKDKVGSFANGELLKVAGSTVATTTSADTAITLPAGGRYTTINHNFYSQSATYAMYVANGVGPAFEYCNGVVCPISTGSAEDTPMLVAEMAQHLFLLWQHGSIQFSAPGEPLIYDVVQGAGEIGFGTDITNAIQANDTAIAVFGVRRIGTISGTDQDTFQLNEVTEDAGAFPWSAQRMDRTLYVDARGVRNLSASQNYGDFKAGAISALFDRYMNNRLASGQTPIASAVSKQKSHYRIYWPDGQGLSVLMAKKNVEAMTFSTGEMRVSCISCADIDSKEYIIAGSESGFVYRLDSGNSHDGETFDYYIMTPFCHYGDISREYRYHKIVVDLIAPVYTNFAVRALFDYEDGNKSASIGEPIVLYGGGGLWNAANWNEFIWTTAINGQAECQIDGVGANASFLFAGTTEEEQDPHVLQAYTIYRSPKRLKR